MHEPERKRGKEEQQAPLALHRDDRTAPPRGVRGARERVDEERHAAGEERDGPRGNVPVVGIELVVWTQIRLVEHRRRAGSGKRDAQDRANAPEPPHFPRGEEPGGDERHGARQPEPDRVKGIGNRGGRKAGLARFGRMVPAAAGRLRFLRRGCLPVFHVKARGIRGNGRPPRRPCSEPGPSGRCGAGRRGSARRCNRRSRGPR